MKRKLTLAMLLSLSATSPMALALGLGDADVSSTLNAPLRASVPLVDAAGIQPGLLNVTVAGERAYAAAGLARTPLAASVRVAVQRRQGQLFVDLTTERPVREPWLDLLLRFDWPSGQQVREVTLLLDPPNYDEMPALVTGNRRVVASPATTPPASAQADRQPAPVAAAPSPRPAATINRDPAWVRSGDTLWGVSGRLRPDSGISMNQMMVALVAANPEAFPSGNVNSMRAGITLAVPDRAAIAARSETDADRIVSAMHQAWANRGSGAPARVPLGGSETSPASAVASASQASPEAQTSSPGEAETVASSEEATAEEATGDQAAQSESQGADEAPAPRLTLLTDAQLAAEQVLATDAEGVGAESVDGDSPVEGEATDQGDGEVAPRVEIDPELLEALYGDGGLSEDQRLLRLENRWQQSQAQLEAVQEERDELQQELGDMRDELAALRDQLAALTAGGSGVDAPGGGGLDAASGEDQEAPWWGSLYPGELDRNLMLGGAGLAALLALWLAVRRRRGREEGASPEGGGVRVAIPGAASPVRPPTTTADDGPSASDASPDDTSVRASLPQAEAINEADIFIAYGRYDQARELLEANLAREPERDDLRLKLLGVHLEQGSREAAERELANLREGGNPAVIEEAEGLMARHGLSSELPDRVAPEPRGERADFGEAAAFPPRLFDQPADADTDEPEAESGAEPGTGRQDDHAPAASVAESSPYRRPDVADDVGAMPELDPESEPAPEPQHEPNHAQEPDQEPQPERKPAPESEAESEEASPLPEVATRSVDDGREVIDYRPPTLDVSAPSREETPMQPSVDFTPEGLGVAEKGAGLDEGESLTRADADKASERPLGSDWEVEEVSFPPLHADNESLSVSAAERLAETRRLVEAGEAGQARELLDELSRSDDPAIRDEALALLRRLDA
ncbi:MAG: FimV/HubP family polar landmark protein [Pseudomonadota bacterium]